MDYNFYLGLYTILAIIIALYGMIKYRTLLNVLTVQIAIFSIAVVVTIPYYMLFPSNTPKDAIAYTAIVSIIYIMGFVLPYIINTNFFTKLYGKFIIYFKFSDKYRIKKYKPFVFYSMLLIAFLFFVLLMIKSGAGTMWLTNPRDAYMDHRRGVGHFYALTAWSLMLGYIFYLWFRKPKFGAISIVFLFSFMAYFLASKGFILYFWIVLAFYWHYMIYPIKNKTIILIGIFIFSMFLGVQLLQGTARNFADTIRYFIYFDSTARFLSIFDQVGYQYGHALITQFWDMVPRSIFPEKPIVYGQYLIHETLNPGLLAKGRAVGTLLWTKYYLDFGIFGVFFMGIVNGLFTKTVYVYFLQHKENPFAFILMIQIGVITIFNYATLSIVFILLILFRWWLRIFGAYNKRRLQINA